MFIGHFGVGFGAKSVAPAVSLGTLFVAVQFVDLLWPTLLLAGIEQVRIAPGITAVTPLDFVSYPLSHSLLMVVVWGALFAVAYWFARRYRIGAWVLGAGVVSHWLLDLLTHRPDLPLYPGGPKLGLGLWQSLPATLAVEVPLFAAGIWLYCRVTRPTDRIGSWALWGLVGFLLLVHLGSVTGPPPPNVTAIAWIGQAQWLLIAWAYWIDRHREVV